ncbi:MAG: hypothetical protein BJ554DRAFT_3416, partial [Olpidium bornovanus]
MFFGRFAVELKPTVFFLVVVVVVFFFLQAHREVLGRASVIEISVLFFAYAPAETLHVEVQVFADTH